MSRVESCWQEKRHGGDDTSAKIMESEGEFYQKSRARTSPLESVPIPQTFAGVRHNEPTLPADALNLLHFNLRRPANRLW